MTHPEYNLSFVHDIPLSQTRYSNMPGSMGWRDDDSSFNDYMSGTTFTGLDPEDLLRNAASGEESVGMDLGGGSQGIALRNLIETGALTKGLVTNFVDRRTPETIDYAPLHHIAGDLALKQTWEEIIDWKNEHASEGLALIMHRPYGALQNLPPSVYAGAARVLIRMLRPGGVFFTQIPTSLHERPENLSNIHRGLLASPEVAEIIPDTYRSYDSYNRPPYGRYRFLHSLIIKARDQ